MAKQVVFPTYKRAVGRGPLLSRYQLSYPKSLVKINDIWTEIISPAQDLVSAPYEQFTWFLGGYTYILTDAEAAASGLPSQYLVSV